MTPDENTTPTSPLVSPSGARPPTGAEILAKAAEARATEESRVDLLLEQPLSTSPSILAFAKAFPEAQRAIKAAMRDSTNPHFKNKYASLAAIWEACREALTSHGFSVLQPVRSRGRFALVTTRILHTSGEWIESTLVITAADDKAQSVMGAITYARRYALAAAVGVAPEDDDGESATRANAGPEGVRQDPGRGPLQRKPGATDELAEDPGASGVAAGAVPTGGSPSGPGANARPTATASPLPVGAAAPVAAGKPEPPVPTVKTVAPPPKPLPKAGTTAPPPPGMKPPARAPGT